jgi:glycosyltransferase involved in cell wall biosynthesis
VFVNGHLSGRWLRDAHHLRRGEAGMESLRFCMVTTFYPPYSFGGDATAIHQLVNMLARRGHEVDVIHCLDSYRALARGAPAAGYPNEPGVTVHSLTSGVGALSPLATYETGYPLFKARKIRRILAAKRFDVTHFHNISLVGGPMVLRYGQGVKLYTMHEHWLVCPTHVLFKFQREPCMERSCFRCTLAYGRPPQLWRYTGLLAKALRHVDAFIAPSEFTLRRHRADGLQVPIVHIPSCISEPVDPPDQAAPSTVPLPARPFFLFVGRLEKLKGLQTVIPLFLGDGAADLVIAGDGQYGDELKRLAQGSARIHFLGRLPPALLRTVYRRAVALLVPSLTFETFGQVVIEAYAARLPVIARDLGPLPDIVAQSAGGLVYRNTHELTEAMERLRTDAALRLRLGEAGYQAYRVHWTEEAHLERYFGLIAEIRARKSVRVTVP